LPKSGESHRLVPVRWRRRDLSEKAAAADSATDADEAGDDGDELPCSRCGGELIFIAERDFREGTGGWGLVFGRLGNLLDGSTRMEMWACDSCGHIEFFVPER